MLSIFCDARGHRHHHAVNLDRRRALDQLRGPRVPSAWKPTNSTVLRGSGRHAAR